MRKSVLAGFLAVIVLSGCPGPKGPDSAPEEQTPAQEDQNPKQDEPGLPGDVPDISALRKKAVGGDAEAQSKLAVCYAKGEGVEKDSAEAVKWYRKAAEQGSVRAQYNLGVAYDNGDGVEKDDIAAYMWFSLSAGGGDEDAASGLTQLEDLMTPAQVAEAQRMSREWFEKHQKADGK